MKVDILHEAGYEQALVGLSLSHKQPVDKMPGVSQRLHALDGGHNKFLESMVVWIDITAARYWWQEFDTYRVGVTKQSESTMHTLMNRKLTQDDFEVHIPQDILQALNGQLEARNFELVKGWLPESFLQRRVVCTNYKTIRRIVEQRYNHRMEEWRYFIGALFAGLEHAEFLQYEE